ncbi:Ubiquitin c-terminal hydrolase [Plasmodium coatneyi]|uniref:ubiquitinyl hydrolase 1 n=1 Tax=Plasmodium coatneyi TaxID=208452 RepID=A0A1B1DZM2_9APIC|nr:Ubiquitin c-terminal hydrolase [Plasmodium coatneyi]ANQ08085.1 Ubiquitin c-terminal hydrolase [Plasmodium coatneyi]
MQRSSNDSLTEWCLIESNPCIFNDMLSRMGAKDLSVEDVYDLDFFDDYISNRDVVTVENVLSMNEYQSEKEKNGWVNPMGEGTGESNPVGSTTGETSPQKGLYSSTVTTDVKYNKLLKNESNIFGIIFLFNIGKSYNRNKFVEHHIPEDLFFAKQVIPNACATQAILSIVLNKEVELNEEIKNIKSFSSNFDSSMKGLTLSNCNFLRNIHNSYKPPIYIEKENLHDEKGKSNDSFHFVSYIQFGGSVYMLDGLQEGPVLIGQTNGADEQRSWIDLAREHIKKEINDICNGTGGGNSMGEAAEGGDGRFNVLAVVKDKEHMINEFCNIHRIVKRRANLKLISLGKEEVDLNDDIDEANFNYPNIPTVEELPNDMSELLLISEKATGEINFLQSLLQEQMQLKLTWNKELTFKFFNFYPFVMSSLKLMAKHNILKEAYEKQKQKHQQQHSRGAA